MKKLLMICGLLLGVIGFANAQQQGMGRVMGGGRGMMMKPEERVKLLDEKLKLSDEQKTKLTALFTEQADSFKKMREKAQADGVRPDMETMKKLREENEAKLTALLTTDQKKAYKTWQEEQAAAMKKRMEERQQGGNNNN